MITVECVRRISAGCQLVEMLTLPKHVRFLIFILYLYRTDQYHANLDLIDLLNIYLVQVMVLSLPIAFFLLARGFVKL